TITASPDEYDSVGDVINYSIVVRNSGNVPLSAIGVEDTRTGLDQTIATLAPGATNTISRSYTITQGDINAGEVKNTVSISGSGPGCTTADRHPPAIVLFPYTTLFRSTITASPDEYDSVGDVINYSIVVRNSGNVPLSAIGVEDTRTGLDQTIA